MSGWIATSYTRDRPDLLRLSVSLGRSDGGFKEPTWCWFVYDWRQGAHSLLVQGAVVCGLDEDASLKEAQTAASEWADRRSNRRCTRCGMTETAVENASDQYCDGPGPHPEGSAQSSQHHFHPWPSA